MQKKHFASLSRKFLLASLFLSLGTCFSGEILADDTPEASNLYDAKPNLSDTSKKADKKKISKKKENNSYTNSNGTIAGNTRDGITPKKIGKKKHHRVTVRNNTPQPTNEVPTGGITPA